MNDEWMLPDESVLSLTPEQYRAESQRQSRQKYAEKIKIYNREYRHRIGPEKRRAYKDAERKARAEKRRMPSPEERANKNAEMRVLYAADKDMRAKAKERMRLRALKNPAQLKAQRLRYAYGMTIEQHDLMLAAQEGACAICGFSDQANPQVFPLVDHCHTTGTVRGLLCMSCNQGLGKFKDSQERLATAIQYLQRAHPIESFRTEESGTSLELAEKC